MEVTAFGFDSGKFTEPVKRTKSSLAKTFFSSIMRRVTTATPLSSSSATMSALARIIHRCSYDRDRVSLLGQSGPLRVP